MERKSLGGWSQKPKEIHRIRSQGNHQDFTLTFWVIYPFGLSLSVRMEFLQSAIPAAAAAAAAKLLQSCPTLCGPIDGSPPGSSVPGILQARTLEWVAISFSNAWKWKVKVKSLSHSWLLATPWTAAHQAPPSMDFPGKSTGLGCHCLLLSNSYRIINNKQKKWLTEEGKRQEAPGGAANHPIPRTPVGRKA